MPTYVPQVFPNGHEGFSIFSNEALEGQDFASWLSIINYRFNKKAFQTKPAFLKKKIIALLQQLNQLPNSKELESFSFYRQLTSYKTVTCSNFPT